MSMTIPKLTPELVAKAQANAVWARERFPIVATATTESFGAKLRKAVQERQRHRRPRATIAGAGQSRDDDGESFGTKLVKAVQARLAGRQRVRRR